MVIDRKTAYLICGSTILVKTEVTKIVEAVLALVALFYLIDADYPKPHELGLTMLHNLVFGDMNTPEDIIEQFETVKEQYVQFKKECLENEF